MPRSRSLRRNSRTSKRRRSTKRRTLKHGLRRSAARRTSKRHVRRFRGSPNCNDFDCTITDDKVTCTTKQSPHQQFIFYLNKVISKSNTEELRPTPTKEEKAKMMASVDLRHAMVYMNNKPVTILGNRKDIFRTFKLEILGNVVQFSNTPNIGLTPSPPRRTTPPAAAREQRAERLSTPKPQRTAASQAVKTPAPRNREQWEVALSLPSKYVAFDSTIQLGNEVEELVSGNKKVWMGIEDDNVLNLKAQQSNVQKHVLIEGSKNQCIMLFGTSGAGKTEVSGKILREWALSHSSKQHGIFLKSISVVYGQAWTDGKNLVFSHLHNNKLEITGKMMSAFSQLNFTKDERTRDFANIPGLIVQVQEILQYMQDPSLEKAKQHGLHFVTQTVNNPQSSRCLTVYELADDKGNILKLFDAPGTEQAMDMIHGLYIINNSDTDYDKFVQEFLEADLKVVDRKLEGSFLTLCKTYGIEVMPHNNPSVARMRRDKQERTGGVMKEVAGNQANANAFVPGLDNYSTQKLSEQVDRLIYCQNRIRETLYINLLVGEMARTLDMRDQNLQLLSTFMTVNPQNPQIKKNSNTLTLTITDIVGMSEEFRTVQSVRALYFSDKPLGKQITTPKAMSDLQQDLKKKAESYDILRLLLPIKSHQDDDQDKRAIIVMPIVNATAEERDITVRGVGSLVRQLVGSIESMDD